MKKELSLKKIGFISKLNGYKGELVLATNEEDFFEEKFLFMMMEGIPVPFYVESLFEKGGNVIVKFEDVNDEPKALQMVKCEIFVEQKNKKKATASISIQNLIHYSIVDSVFGDLGPIIRIEEFPQQEIAVCLVKEKEVLIPLNPDFIDSIDDDKTTIFVTLPEGLIDIYIL